MSYYCSRCDEEHDTVTDADGYELANCPKAGTVLVSTP